MKWQPSGRRFLAVTLLVALTASRPLSVDPPGRHRAEAVLTAPVDPLITAPGSRTSDPERCDQHAILVVLPAETEAVRPVVRERAERSAARLPVVPATTHTRAPPILTV